MTPTQAILDSIENRLRELNQEISSLQAARGALDRGSAVPTKTNRRTRAKAAVVRNGGNGNDPHAAPASNPQKHPQKARASVKPARAAPRNLRSRSARAADVVPAGKLELLLSEAGGLTTSALAERANGDREQVLTLLRELETAGRVRRTGQRRGTRWHAITDEDRIRERAAELAARSRSAA